MQYRDNSTSVSASYVRGYPSYSRTTRPRVANSSAGHAPVKCIGCISPRSSRAPSRTDTRASHRAHASSCICMFDSSPLLGPAAPRALSLSLAPSLPTVLFLSRHLFLRFSTDFFPLSIARLVELFFVCRASPLYRWYAPTTASREPTGERVTTCFAPNRNRSSFIGRSSKSHGTPSCVRLTRAADSRALLFEHPGCGRDGTFRDIKHPRARSRRKASGPIDARKCNRIDRRSKRTSNAVGTRRWWKRIVEARECTALRRDDS